MRLHGDFRSPENSKPEYVGNDAEGRPVYLTFAPESSTIGVSVGEAIAPFALFLGWDSQSQFPGDVASTAQSVLNAGARYVMLWGSNCGEVESVFDEIVVGPHGEGRYGSVVTTSHAQASIEEALADAGEGLTSLFVFWMGNVNWYNEAQNCLEEMLV